MRIISYLWKNLLRARDDAFSIPYIDENRKTRQYISTLIIASSGRFVGNAKEKILEKTKNKNVIFLDIDKIQELLEKYIDNRN